MEQFKTLCDIEKLIKEYELMLMRPTLRLSHPTLYRKRDAAPNEVIIKGVREKDWFLSEDHQWVKPHNQMGLSFSSNFKNLRRVFSMKQKHNKSSIIDIYWVLETADIPPGLKFVPDHEVPGHYYLTVTETIPLTLLISKLKLLAKRMSIIKNGGKTL